MDKFRNFLILSFIFILSIISLSNSDRIKSTKIYKSLEHKYSCFRRLNKTNQIGCNTKESGNVGVIHLVNTEKDLDYVIRSGNHYPYVPVISTKFFNFKTLNNLKSNSERISGVLVLDRDVSQLESHSADKSCPNDYFDLYVNNESYSHCQKQIWNLVENRENHRIDENLMFNDWPFPIFLIKNDTNITEIENCFQRYSKDWPLCSVHLIASSYGAKDTETCMRRSNMDYNILNMLRLIKYCRPFWGYNMFSYLLTTTKNITISDKSVVVISARLDSFSMFTDISPGADSVITSLITLLSIVHTLSQPSIKDIIEKRFTKKNVLFALLDGEAFEYIGSSRTVFDMNSGKFPTDPKDDFDMTQIRVKHFSHFIELNQLAIKGNDTQNKTFYIHNNFETSNPAFVELQNIITKNAINMSDLSFESIDGSPLPPSSLQTFLKEDNTLIGVVITNHQKEYKNKFYNSLYDNFDKLNINESKLAKSLTHISTVISKSIFDLLSISSNLKESYETDIRADEELMKSLLKCYLINTNCSLFNTVWPSKYNPNITFETYIQSKNKNILRKITYLLMSYFNGETLDLKTKEECDDNTKQDKRYDYTWIPGPNFEGICLRSHSILQEYTSPAFTKYKTDGITNSSLYSTWTQSVFKETSVRIFVSNSFTHQLLTLMTGIIITITSTVFIIYIKKSLSNSTSVTFSTEKHSETN